MNNTTKFELKEQYFFDGLHISYELQRGQKHIVGALPPALLCLIFSKEGTMPGA